MPHNSPQDPQQVAEAARARRKSHRQVPKVRRGYASQLRSSLEPRQVGEAARARRKSHRQVPGVKRGYASSAGVPKMIWFLGVASRG